MVKTKAKGSRVERRIAKELDKLDGVSAHRVPGSGSFQSMPFDVKARLYRDGRPIDYNGEVKARANGEGFKQLERWMGRADFLVLVRDRTDPQVVVSWGMFCEFLELLGGDDDD